MIGQTLGHYRIVEQIGAGGMGVVYRAWDTQLQRTVAIKLLGERVPADETARARLLEEARTASALNHPNICTIYEVGEADGQAYITMEHVEGQPLSALAPGEGLPVETAVHYGTQIADALAHAHEHGVVHRDLKSSNVVVTPEGRAKVLDFGLAKRLRKEELSEATQSRVSLTEPGAIAGTLHYLAPEVLRGEEASPRSDLWALGVVLYEVATGQLPFKGQTGFELTAAILREPPAPLPPGVPAGLRGIVQRCLAKEPAQRYQRAGEVRAALEAVQSDSAIAPAAPQPRPPARPRTLAAVVALVLAVAALLVAFVGLNVSGWRERLFGRAGPARIESLAVLPLENLSGDPAQDYFADGMTEALIADLAQIGNLRVISRTSVMRYKGTKKSLPEIARELKVDAVVEGSVLRSGEQVRITAQLIHAATDRHLWARSYERDLRDILALQSEVARTIASEIQVKLTPQEQSRLASARPVNPEAYQLYLKGRYYWNKRTEQGVKKGIEYLRQAIEKDPGYALAYAGLADAYNALGSRFEALPPREAYLEAKAAAVKALEIDGALAEAHTSLAGVRTLYDWDWLGAEREYRRAIELNPNYAHTHHYYSHYLMAMGRTEESLAESKRALELERLDLATNAHLGWHYLFARQYDQAIEQLRNTSDMEPNFYHAHLYLGLVHEQKGELSKAAAEFQKARLLDETPEPLASLGHTYAVSGEPAGAQKVLDELNELSKRRYVSPYFIAVIYAGLGKKDQAFEWLKKAYEERASRLIELKGEPRFDSLRSDPRFKDLLRRVGLPP